MPGSLYVFYKCALLHCSPKEPSYMYISDLGEVCYFSVALPKRIAKLVTVFSNTPTAPSPITSHLHFFPVMRYSYPKHQPLVEQENVLSVLKKPQCFHFSGSLPQEFLNWNTRINSNTLHQGFLCKGL